jgi:hypothetical protein
MQRDGLTDGKDEGIRTFREYTKMPRSLKFKVEKLEEAVAIWVGQLDVKNSL